MSKTTAKTNRRRSSSRRHPPGTPLRKQTDAMAAASFLAGDAGRPDGLDAEIGGERRAPSRRVSKNAHLRAGAVPGVPGLPGHSAATAGGGLTTEELVRRSNY